MISVTAIGEVAPDQYVKRSTAQKGDLLCVSGDLGAAYLGLTLLEEKNRSSSKTRRYSLTWRTRPISSAAS